MQLSERLRLVAEFVTEGYTVADIGTDHGYVPIWLVENGRVPKALAMDIGKGPLQHAKEHIAECGYQDKIETRLSDGLKELKENEADSVVIAGMGGSLIAGILKDGKEVLKTVKELILSPHTEIHLVRHYLIENGYEIIREQMVYDMGKYYTVMKAVHTEDKNIKKIYDENEYNYIYGMILIREKDSVFMEFIKNEKEKLLTVLENLKKGGDVEEKRQQVKEKLEYLNRLEDN
jgi:tRNA (adenine22-N1)-methyltransferase